MLLFAMLAGCSVSFDGTLTQHTLPASDYNQTYTLYVFEPDEAPPDAGYDVVR